MVNKGLVKDKEGNWIDRTPDIPAKITYNGNFLLVTRRKGVEAELGRSLYETTRRHLGPEGAVRGAQPYEILALSEDFLALAEKLNLPRVRIANKEQNFYDEVFFEYQVERNGQIYVCRVVGGKKTKTANLVKVLNEIDQRKN